MRNNSFRVLRVSAAVLGGAAVAAGAFGAHALRDSLSPSDLEVFHTGVRYQMWHALALLILSTSFVPTRTAIVAGFLLLNGTILFSGSLYALALGGPAWIGPVTPVGGIALISGWVLLVFGAATRGRRPGRFSRL